MSSFIEMQSPYPSLINANLGNGNNQLLNTSDEGAPCCGYRKSYYPITTITAVTAMLSMTCLLISLVMDALKKNQLINEHNAIQTIGHNLSSSKAFIILSVAISGASSILKLAIKCAKYIKEESRLINKMDRYTEKWGIYPWCGTFVGLLFPVLVPCYCLKVAADQLCPHQPQIEADAIEV